MIRALRIALDVAAIVSLVLGVAALALWVRSYWRTDRVDVRMPGEVDWPGDHGPVWRTVGVVSSRGTIWLTRREDEVRVRVDEPTPTPPTFGISVLHSTAPWQVERERSGTRWEGYGGFCVGTEYYLGTGASGELWYVALPYWCPAFPLAVMASRVRGRFRRRRAHGLCRVCGYDLRATPERCPECGAVPTKATA